MTLILMRHATRDFNDDDSLSLEGHRLATTLASVLSENSVAPTVLYSSPKKRTRATLQPLAEKLGASVVIDSRLDERDHRESVQDFESRVVAYCNEATLNAKTDPGAVWVACSHLDWLEEIALRLPSDETDFERSEPWPPMAMRIYIFKDEIWTRKEKK